MNIMVTMRNHQQEIQLADYATGTDLLVQLDLTAEQAILIVDGRPVPHTEQLPTGIPVKIVQVASGG